MTDVEGERVSGLPTLHHLYLLAVVVLIEAANRLGSPGLVDRLARGLARLAYRLSREKRRLMERSLARVFGLLRDVERTRIVRGAFYTFWDETLSFIPWRGAARPEPEIAGLQHLQAALAAGEGVVLWESGYFGRHNTHRAGFGGDPHPSWSRDRVVLAYFAAHEREFTEDVIGPPRSQSLASLQRNQIVCITADVPQGHRLLTLSLLGAPKRFAIGMVNLARTCGATLLPLFCIRADDRRIQVIVEPPVPVPHAGSREARVETPLRQYAAPLEAYIWRYPEQYRSWHFPWWEPT